MMFPPSDSPRISALVPRTAALFILLWQLRLIAADMADTPFFAAALAGALGAALFLKRRKVLPIHALITLALVPWAIRFLIALPRWLIPGDSAGSAILFDSLLLNLDRNNFCALLPFYWTSVSSYFCFRSRVFLRADIIAADTLFLVMFSIAPTASISAYRWPILAVALFALTLFLQILSLVLSTPPELKPRGRESVFAGSFLFLLVFLGGALFIRPFQEKAVERGGGLIEPNIFRFDFSQVLRLESEISVSDDLVLIVKKDPGDTNTLLRRYTLSGYDAKQGFFRLDDVDEAAHPRRLPDRPVALPAKERESFRVTEQEYYLVNFDASAFIGMNMPVEITPFETWDASSFNSAYAVKSHTSEALPFELIEAVRGRPDPEKLSLSAEEYALYTNYGGDEAIAAFSRETIEGPGRILRGAARNPPSYWEQVQMVYDRLKYGEYRYSLKPGIAPDGDQLKYFLFTSKKGYCSYYAFAFTLMLRSLGIPSRVAAGFFVDPATETFNYYPVRQDMAHAWVEVWFPGYGWIEYDPTSQKMAEGEEFRFSGGTPPELFERLMKEILENRSRLKIKEGEGEENAGGLAGLGGRAAKFLRQRGPLLAAAALVLLFLVIRLGFFWLSLLRGNPRKKALYLWAHAKRRLALAGTGRARAAGFAVGEAEWAKAHDSRFGGLYALYLHSAAARFAPDFAPACSAKTAGLYAAFGAEYRNALPLRRRLLAWILPPLALLLPPPPLRDAGKTGSGRGKTGGKTAGIILLAAVLILQRGETGRAQETISPADTLYEDALAAQAVENWERAVLLLDAGGKEHPGDIRFPWTLGNLYYNRELYRLAWDEYRRAEKIIPWDTELLSRLANTAGYLNRNEVSAEYLEKVIALDPDDREAAGSLAWMYFKLHRLEEGERLLLDALKRSGDDPDFFMILGTIYSDMFRYDDAKAFYEKAAEGAEESGDRLFAALVHYNWSILESRFYRYSLAYGRTSASLEAMDRASGRLARGEISMRRAELSRALEDFREAYGMDSSPLSKLNLAEAYQTGGRLNEALLYAKDCLNAGDDSWMMSYGIDPVRYKRDIHEILESTYEGLMKAEAFVASANIKEKTQSLFRSVSYRFRAAVHRHLFRKYSLLSAAAYGAPRPGSDIHVEALLQYYDAFESYPHRALTYLRKARAFEEPLIPGSAPSYDFEEGRLLKNRELLESTLAAFDPLWERDMITKVYAELAARGGREARRGAAERLYALNRGALLQNGTKLPVALRVEAADVDEGTLRKAVQAAGLEPLREGAPRYTLTLSATGENTVSCELYDGGKGTVLYRQGLPLPSLSRALRDGLFSFAE